MVSEIHRVYIRSAPALPSPWQVICGFGYNRMVVINDGIRQEGQQWGDEYDNEVDEYNETS